MEIKRLKREEAFAIFVDFQERLMAVMEGREALEQSAVKLAKGLKILNIPILVTQQYTKGLGPTTEAVAAALGDFEPIEKKSFSVLGAPEAKQAIAGLKKDGRKSVVLSGIETHICVEQTALDLAERGFQVFVAADAIRSRSSENREIALRRLEQAGVVVTSVESILYEMLGGAEGEGFKEISALVK